ncbi:TPA: helix-turn-helix domain-containing protein [Streptococcus equi subsp. equi]|uniref:S24 family peptidase n=4 Tax=Streptococcus equi TaxID=1336 RepID=UPI000659AA8D|nr:S24 family peptidase [Streptococcus equi]MBT1204128.1 helix-turn-helix domain-containing protein [Streptococcus equi subsp. equi]MBT1208307.1 helix-turn-helix domain-containing protein [Streptococcus equi subsp. equi]MBT1213754.1 helix-turn-helix domain-containing protein [Streptococcus equi subsp. equi]MBT1225075.1 helix-turn-helix domain-containing protein [Streptococcus equi subsp. equi]MBT1228941.1 helix-turn-helix domain-containing protein [Streptococcus equi subsp. equi]
MQCSSTSNRLKQLMSERNLRQVDILEKSKPFQKQLGVKMGRSTLSQYVSGKSVPAQRQLYLLSKTLNVSEAWLMGYDVAIERIPDEKRGATTEISNQPEIVSIYNQLEQPRQEKVLDFAKEQLEEQKHEQNNLFEVTGISYAAAASGLGRGFDVDDYDTYTVYTDEEPPRYDYAIGVRGDSMLPTYEAGDMLYLVDKGMSNYSGQLCVIAYNGQTYFKKVYTEANGLRLVSLNKKYDDIFIDYPPAEDTYIKIFDVIGSFVPVEM